MGVDAILTEAYKQKQTLRIIIGKREFTGTLAGLGGERPVILVTVPVSKTGACVELCESFSRTTIARLLKQGFFKWPTISHSRMKPPCFYKVTKPPKR